ncbi:HD domain-containing protein [Lignipirellula cremea]|uniref:HD domain protein n=1 Tax=Lignipirellula cremea TaxID=2528010 RepID=A0A518E234_9BACT|nr:HD domain-containing protein [Lignipirellula cremea]QDU98157.1 HD domain protein [Lignipirellula cremea]
MAGVESIPEVKALDDRRRLIRIPDQIDVPLTPRVRRLIDTAEFHRLASISQLGLVSLVYPAATHSRFEHSLGVYRMALLYLKQLAHDERFAQAVSAEQGEQLIVAALLHDLGHWPFCHPLEDMRLPGVPRHEQFADRFLLHGEPAELLDQEWSVSPAQVASLLHGKPQDQASRILNSLLSGPIDIDKMDYLQRDSLHAGVPYGRNFDEPRLIGALCLNQQGDGLALSEKGRTAAEMMVFARYVMFSEVYWHHAVRGATAMLQRAFYELHTQLDLESLFHLTEQPMIAQLQSVAGDSPAGELLAGLFGPRRRLYKRLAQYNFIQQPDTYQKLARRPYPWLVACAEQFALQLSERIGQPVAPHEVLFDAPPVKLEVQFNVEIFYPKEDLYRELGQVSPVVQTLAQKQFDDYVKQVRIFLHPRLQSLVTPDLANELAHSAAAAAD